MYNDIGIIVQARMGSKRLRNKTCLKLGQHLLLDWVINRLKKIKKIKKIILATTNKQEDKKLISIAKKRNILFYCGSSSNVLKRFFEAAKKFNIKHIIRICADRPFICPLEINLLIKCYLANQKKYVFNHRNFGKFNYADGFGAEMLSFKDLSMLNIKAHTKEHKEHVTQYFWEKKMKKKLLPCNSKIPLDKRYLRAVIDTKKDFQILQAFVKKNNFTYNTKSAIIINKLHKFTK